MNGSNPFSTRFVRPGALPFRFASADALQRLVQRFADCRHRGAIVGPHGSGKSTLLATLVPHFQEAGWQVHQVALHDGQRTMPRGSQQPNGSSRQLLVIDGYEQLGWFSRWRVRYKCWRRGWGLLVTAHQSIGLPVIFETRVSLEGFQGICQQLLSGRGTTLTLDDMAEAHSRSGGNVREALFDLYDRYDQQHRGTDASNPRRACSVEQEQSVAGVR